MSQAVQTAAEVQVVVFELMGEDYALPVQNVREILTWQPVTAVPRAAEHVLGITNIRGHVTPVISLRSVFGLPHAEADGRTRIIVVEHEADVVGVVVDAVKEVLRVSGDTMTQPSEVVRNADYLRSVINTGQHLILLLDLGAVLDHQAVRRAVASLPQAAD